MGGTDKPHNPLVISVQKIRIRPGKGKGKSDALCQVCCVVCPSEGWTRSAR